MAKNRFDGFPSESDVEYYNKSPKENFSGNYSEEFKSFETKLNAIKQQIKDDLFNIMFTNQSKSHQQEMLDALIKNIEDLVQETNLVRKKLEDIFSDLDEQGNYRDDLLIIKNDFANIKNRLDTLNYHLSTDIQDFKQVKQHIN